MIEVVAALAIMGILILPLAALLMQGTLQQQRAGIRTQAMAAAIGEMENIKAAAAALPGLFTAERAASEEYPYVTGRPNYHQGALGEEGIYHEIHYLAKELFLNQELYILELFLIEVFDGEGSLLLSSFYCRREI